MNRSDDSRRRTIRIRCPVCGWQPGKNDVWQCRSIEDDGRGDSYCGHVWNTFDTHGRCPACGKQWTVTICLRCHQYSPHEDWYEKDDEPS